MRKIDIWYGIGSGHSIRMEGEITDDGEIRITDKKWLDSIGWDEPYWDYPAHPVSDEEGWAVSSDDYGWSEIDKPPPDELLRKGASVIGTDELWSDDPKPHPWVKIR